MQKKRNNIIGGIKKTEVNIRKNMLKPIKKNWQNITKRIKNIKAKGLGFIREGCLENIDSLGLIFIKKL